MKKTVIPTIVLVVVTMMVVVICGICESIPNHRFQGSDWDLFTTINLFPALFFLHGIVAGFLLIRGASKIMYPATLIPLTTLTFFIVESVTLYDFSLKLFFSAILIGVIYFVVSAIGALLIVATRAIGKQLIGYKDFIKTKKEKVSVETDSIIEREENIE